MSGRGLGVRLAAAFLAPAEAGGDHTHVAEVVAPASVSVLCRPGDAWVTGGAIALADRGAAVVVACGEGVAAPATRAPATRGARRLADVLTTRGHAAVATGRLVHVLVEPDDAGAAVRIAAAADPARCVTVHAGPRDDGVDGFLRGQDHVLVEADDAVADLALTSLAQSDVPARRITLAGAPSTARALAAAGVALTPQVKALVAEALR